MLTRGRYSVSHAFTKCQLFAPRLMSVVDRTAVDFQPGIQNTKNTKYKKYTKNTTKNTNTNDAIVVPLHCHPNTMANSLQLPAGTFYLHSHNIIIVVIIIIFVIIIITININIISQLHYHCHRFPAQEYPALFQIQEPPNWRHC